MRIRGRFLAFMAVLGALVSMMSVMPASAGTAGTIALTGGVTTDSVIWYSTNTGSKIMTVSVTDPDANVLKTLNGVNAAALCTSGSVLVNFPCTILPEVGGGTAYTTPAHTFMEDADGNDLPDNLLVRNLQDQVTGFLASGTSAATGAITTTAALGTRKEADRFTAGAAIAADVANQAIAAASQPARYGFVMAAGTGTTCDWGSGGVTVHGTTIHPVTFAETASQSEILQGAASTMPAIAEGDKITTAIFKPGTVTFSIDVTGTCTGGAHEIATGFKFIEYTTVAARFKYNVVDTIASTLVSVTSSSHTAVPIALALTETGAGTGVFSSTVELHGTLANHNTGTPKKIYATDGAEFTVKYKDASPAADITKTAKADMKAPTITLVQPAQDSFTNVTAQTFVVTIEDPASSGGKAAGLATADVDNLVTQQLGAGAGTESPGLTPLLVGTNKFQTSYSLTIGAQGVTKWWIATKDKVGNTPIFTNATGVVTGAGNPAAATTTPHKPFLVNIDTAAPTIVSASVATGGKMTTATASSVTTTTWSAKNTAKSVVTVKFEDGGAAENTGFAYIDPATLVLSEWSIGGANPTAVTCDTMNSTTHGAYCLFELGADQATDARPYVEYSGTSAKDFSGNLLAKFSGTGTGAVGIGRVKAVDGLAPEISATTNVTIAQKEVVITATSSEPLSTTPSIWTTITEPTNGTVNANKVAQSVTQTSTTTWTAKFTNADNNSSGQHVVVSGTDTANITTIFGDDSPAKTPKVDVLYFEVDYEDPTVAFSTPQGAFTTDVTEGVVWLIATFDEDEDDQADYRKDNSTKVTVESMTLKVKSAATGTNISTDITQLFTNDSIAYTLAVSLTPETYNLKIKGKDAMGNSVESNADITVVKKTAYSLTLKPGVNLVSIPGTPEGDGGSLDNMFGGIEVSSVVTYDRAADAAGGNPWLTSVKDAATGTFSGDISAIEAGKSYFVTADASGTAKVFIKEATAALPPTVGMLTGWNAIGYWTPADAATLDADAYFSSVTWSVAYKFDPTPGQGWSVIRPDGNLAAGATVAKGVGYLVYVTKDGTLTP